MRVEPGGKTEQTTLLQLLRLEGAAPKPVGLPASVWLRVCGVVGSEHLASCWDVAMRPATLPCGTKVPPAPHVFPLRTWAMALIAGWHRGHVYLSGDGTGVLAGKMAQSLCAT